MKFFIHFVFAFTTILPFSFSQTDVSGSKSKNPLNGLNIQGSFEYSAVSSQFRVFKRSKYFELPGNSFSIGCNIGYRLSNLNFIKSGIRYKYSELYFSQVINKIYDENSGVMNSDGSVTINYTFNPNATLGNIKAVSNATFIKPANSDFYKDGEEIRFGFGSINSFKALSIPLIFRHRFSSNNFSIFIEAGIEAEYIIDATMDITSTRGLGLKIINRRHIINNSSGQITWLVDVDNFTTTESFNSDLRKVNASLIGSLGMSYQPKPIFSIEFGLTLGNGITSIRKSEPVYIRTLALELGINLFF